MSEREYLTNSTYVNYCKMRGYEERSDREEGWFRNIAYINYSAATEKKNRDSIQKFWPIASDKSESKDTYFMTKEMLEKIKKAHKLK